jgi:hypothetical protein
MLNLIERNSNIEAFASIQLLAAFPMNVFLPNFISVIKGQPIFNKFSKGEPFLLEPLDLKPMLKLLFHHTRPQNCITFPTTLLLLDKVTVLSISHILFLKKTN